MPEKSSVPLISWKKVILTVIPILLITTLIAVGIWFYVQFQTKTEDNTAATTNKLVATPSPKKTSTSSAKKTDELESTKNWTLYTDAIGKFSLKYPVGWVKTNEYDNSNSQKSKTGEIWLRLVEFQKSSGKELLGMFMVNVANNPENLSLTNFYNSHQTFFSGYLLQETSELTIDSKATLKITYDGVQSYDQVGYVVASNQKVYLFNYLVITDTKNTVSSAEYEQIFSTVTLK
ncbi:MAG: hypothetical protein A2172_03520 [Candidatus Woykebacteria bacterium RBG_13_40_15]|uniref:PsbP C-terminal domain-containing protein n=1 Tax=Candidatus Woykebacteria bacterium RBG_13_40_15 TaxID=1802593 RepID=A0A1G1W5N1_9BACT|nr:MAG: hypothetical protein A2172_03520 [Candidatus Woykebacteria bacterium RBG_13_40_15]